MCHFELWAQQNAIFITDELHYGITVILAGIVGIVGIVRSRWIACRRASFAYKMGSAKLATFFRLFIALIDYVRRLWQWLPLKTRYDWHFQFVICATARLLTNLNGNSGGSGSTSACWDFTHTHMHTYMHIYTRFVYGIVNRFYGPYPAVELIFRLHIYDPDCWILLAWPLPLRIIIVSERVNERWHC